MNSIKHIKISFLVFNKLAVVVMLISLASHVSGQTIDSLKKVLLVKDLQDSSRLKILNDLAFTLLLSHPVEAEEYLNEALLISGNHKKFKIYKAETLRLQGIIHDLHGNYVNAIHLYERAILLVEGHPFEYSKLLNALGLAYYHLGHYEKALEVFLKGLQIVESNRKMDQLINFYNNIGLVYHDERDFEKALYYYKKAFILAETVNNLKTKARAANNIASVFADKGIYKESIEYNKISLELKLRENDQFGIAGSYHNFAIAYKIMGDYDSALIMLDLSDKIRKSLHDSLGIVNAQHTRMEVLVEKKEFTKALRLLKENSLLVKKLNSPEQLINHLQIKSTLYRQLSRYKEALETTARLMSIKDSVYNTRKARQMAEMQALYELEKKDHELDEMTKEKETQRNLAVITVGIFLLAAVSVVIIIFVRFHQRKKQFMIEQKIQEREIENAFLREQELKKELEYKNRELTSYTVNFIQKSKLINEMKEAIEDKTEADIHRKIKSINKIIESNFQIDKEWNDFKMHFQQVHNGFFENLKEFAPELSSNDLKLCALIRLNMDIKETARILGISPESVKTARYRLRKKLNLEKEESLFEFISRIEKTEQKNRVEISIS